MQNFKFCNKIGEYTDYNTYQQHKLKRRTPKKWGYCPFAFDISPKRSFSYLQNQNIPKTNHRLLKRLKLAALKLYTLATVQSEIRDVRRKNKYDEA